MNKKSIISLIKELKTFLKEKRKLSYEDPSINPVSSLAHLLSRKFVNDEIDFPKINSIIEHLSQELILQRASNLYKNNSFLLTCLYFVFTSHIVRFNINVSKCLYF